MQHRTACKIQLDAIGPQNGRRGLERCLPLGLENKFFLVEHSFSEEWLQQRGKNEKWKIITFIVATYIIAC